MSDMKGSIISVEMIQVVVADMRETPLFRAVLTGEKVMARDLAARLEDFGIKNTCY